MSDNTQDQENVQPVGDDGMNDDQRRLAKQKERDAQQRKVDEAGDAERARREREQGEPEGSRGRNAEEVRQDDPVSTKTGETKRRAASPRIVDNTGK